MATAQAMVPSVRDLIGRAQKGDASVLPALKLAFAADRTLWEQVGNLALQAREIWLQVICKDDLAFKTAVEMAAADVQHKLEAEGEATEAERLLCEAAALTWMQANYASCLFGSDVLKTKRLDGGLRRFQAESHRRYAASLKTLVEFRKLLKLTKAPYWKTFAGHKVA